MSSILPQGPHRFTPTRVGKTDHAYSLTPRCPVHPHAGGENARRGRLDNYAGRFTPTRVGKTPHSQLPKTDTSVHPHAGGENVYVHLDVAIAGGSPPRGWGKRGDTVYKVE